MNTEDSQLIEMPKSEVFDSIVEWIYKVDIFRCGLELRVWEKIAAGEDSADKMASVEGWNPSGTRMLLDAICSLGLLTKQGNRYFLVPESEFYLLPNKPTYKGKLPQTEFNWEGNGKLAESIRTGKRPIHYSATTAEMVDLWIADYARRWAAPESFLQQADSLWQSLNISARDGLRVLDVACGPAPESLALARQHPGVSLTLLDWEDILQTACKAATALGVENQVTTKSGDLWSLEYGCDLFDVVWLGNITHFFSPEENIRLFRKAHDALVHGGAIIIDSVARRDSEFPAWGEIWLYAVSVGGAAYDFHEYKDMLELAGYIEIEDIDKQPIKAIKP